MKPYWIGFLNYKRNQSSTPPPPLDDDEILISFKHINTSQSSEIVAKEIIDFYEKLGIKMDMDEAEGLIMGYMDPKRNGVTWDYFVRMITEIYRAVYIEGLVDQISEMIEQLLDG